jgi:cytochrome bd-type quinol oxidase subunit 1
LGKTVVYGSILGFEGQLAFFNHQGSIYVICFRNRQVLRMYLIAVLTGVRNITGNDGHDDGT